MIGFVEILRSDTRNFLWSDIVQAELFGAIRKFWPMLNEESREELCNMILKGPPRDLLPSASENKWAHFVDLKIWERLARIAQVDSRFSGPAAERLHEIERENPQWRLQGAEREDAVFRSEAYMGPSPEARSIADDWLVLPVPEIAERIRSGIQQYANNIYPGYFPNEVWDSIIEKDRAKTLKILRYFLEKGFYRKDTWSRGLWAFSKATMRDENSRELLNLIMDFPVVFLERIEITNAVIDILNSMAKSLGENEIESNLEFFLDFWDALFDYAIVESHSGFDDSNFDVTTYAINHPAGKMTEILFYLFPGRNSPRGSGIHSDMKTRLERILRSYGPNLREWRAGYAIIASRLARLHFLDPEWTEKQVVPSFDWGNGEKAKISWGAYLFSPRVDPSLWEAIKKGFILVFEHSGDLPQNAYRLFANIVIGRPDAISYKDARRCVRAMSKRGRYEVLNYFSSSLENAETKSSVMWEERIKPWINEVWPRDKEFRSPDESFAFAELAISTGNCFRDAVDILDEFLDSLGDRWTHHILFRIERNSDSENSILGNEPRTLLEFMDKILPENIDYFVKDDVKKLLNRMKEADSAIENNPHYDPLLRRTL